LLLAVVAVQPDEQAEASVDATADRAIDADLCATDALQDDSHTDNLHGVMVKRPSNWLTVRSELRPGKCIRVRAGE
jgi:hypothetical protein